MRSPESIHTETTSLKDWGLLFILCLIWGSSFILIKKGLLAFRPLEVGALRIAISALAFVPIYLWILKERVPWNKMKYVILMGMLGNGITAVIYPLAQTHVESSVAGILNSMTPIFTWFAGMLFFATRFKANQMTGVLIGFGGAAMLIFLNHRFQFSLDEYSLLIVVATLSYGFSANIVKVYLQDVHPIAMTAVAIFVIGIPAIAYLFTTDTISSIGNSPQAMWSFLAIVALSIGGTALANILFFQLIQRTNAVFASSVAYLIPVTAMIWGMLDGEFLGLIHIIGMALILIGVWLLRR